MNRRRYDTVELVAELRRERRNGVLLTVTALVIVGFLAAFYFVGVNGSDVPEVPKAKSPSSAVKPPSAPITAPPAAVVSPPEMPPQPANVTIQLPRKMPLWLDDQSIGKTKRHEQTLDAGKHVVKTKLGRKVLSETFEAEGGKTYAISFDAKRKRFVVNAGP